MKLSEERLKRRNYILMDESRTGADISQAFPRGPAGVFPHLPIPRFPAFSDSKIRTPMQLFLTGVLRFAELFC
jgi:hypothetical protein